MLIKVHLKWNSSIIRKSLFEVELFKGFISSINIEGPRANLFIYLFFFLVGYQKNKIKPVF